MLRNIAERVRIPFARSTPIVVFNSQSWTRDDVVTAHASIYGDVNPGDIADYRKAMRLVDESGASVPFQVLQTATMISDGIDIAFLARGVPSLGYKTYFLVPAEKPDAFPAASTVKLDDPDPAKPKTILAHDQLENEFYRVTVDRSTGGITVFDKELNRVMVRDVAVAATEERGGNSLSLEPKTGRDLLFTPARVEVEENNPIRTIVRIQGDVAGVPIVERLFLYAGLKKIDLETTVEWKQGRLMRLEQRFPYEQKDAPIRYGTPFGSAGSADTVPNSGPHLRDEVEREEWQTWRQIQDWMFIGNAAGGFTLNADRQLIFLAPGAVHAGMLRGTYSSQQIVRDGKRHLVPMPPAGAYVFRYSLTSGKGDWAAAKSHRFGAAFANPLIPFTTVNELSPRELPPTHSFCRLDAGNLIIDSIKKAEQDGSIIARFHETDGTATTTPVEFLGGRRNFQPLNMLEEKTSQEDQQVLAVKPYEIGTIQIKLR
jgi:alpha-mannosidase